MASFSCAMNASPIPNSKWRYLPIKILRRCCLLALIFDRLVLSFDSMSLLSPSRRRISLVISWRLAFSDEALRFRCCSRIWSFSKKRDLFRSSRSIASSSLMLPLELPLLTLVWSRLRGGAAFLQCDEIVFWKSSDTVGGENRASESRRFVGESPESRRFVGVICGEGGGESSVSGGPLFVWGELPFSALKSAMSLSLPPFELLESLAAFSAKTNGLVLGRTLPVSFPSKPTPPNQSLFL
mmetsp:Transcript_15981/g.40071  ORF Transcript_15981/g.40071 Transcript_15981/m.40071 type:complete len:240 (+) Transcript_15981:146-865(+)